MINNSIQKIKQLYDIVIPNEILEEYRILIYVTKFISSIYDIVLNKYISSYYTIKS